MNLFENELAPSKGVITIPLSDDVSIDVNPFSSLSPSDQLKVIKASSGAGSSDGMFAFEFAEKFLENVHNREVIDNSSLSVMSLVSLSIAWTELSTDMDEDKIVSIVEKVVTASREAAEEEGKKKKAKKSSK